MADSTSGSVAGRPATTNLVGSRSPGNLHPVVETILAEGPLSMSAVARRLGEFRYPSGQRRTCGVI